MNYMEEHDGSDRAEYIVSLSNLYSIVRDVPIVVCTFVFIWNVVCFLLDSKINPVIALAFLVSMVLYVRIMSYIMKHWYIGVYKDVLVISRVFRNQFILSVSEVVYDVDKYGSIVIGSMWLNHITTVQVFAENRDRLLRKLEKESHKDYVEGY